MLSGFRTEDRIHSRSEWTTSEWISNGFGEHGLPTSITFTGRIWTEARLLTIAKMYQDATGFHAKRPNFKV